MDKQYFVNVVNLTTGKMYSLPTLYTDRVEACVCGQNYCRDRQQENHDDVFYRILIAKDGKDGKVAEPSYFTVVDDEDEDDETCPHPEQECCESCPFYSECWEEDEEDEEPEHGESVYGDTEEPDWEQHQEELFQSLLNYCRI